MKPSPAALLGDGLSEGVNPEFSPAAFLLSANSHSSTTTSVVMACGLNGVVKSFDGFVEVIWSVSGKGLL